MTHWRRWRWLLLSGYPLAALCVLNIRRQQRAGGAFHH